MRHLVLAVFAPLTFSLLAPSRALAFNPRLGFTISPNPADPGAPVTLTVTVSGCQEPGVPVNFYDNTTRTNLGSRVPNSAHVAELTVSTLPTGTQNITASYNSGSYCGGPANPVSRSVTILADVGGYINPKYIVLGVYWVVPGSQSFAKYCANTSVGTTDSITNTFTSSYQNSISIKAGIGIPGFLNGSQTQTFSSTYAQSSLKGGSCGHSNQFPLQPEPGPN